jgi:hypothetical protein
MLGLTGGFATPLLLGGGNVWFVFSYALVLNAGAVFAARRRNWRWPEAVALAGTVLLYASHFSIPPGMRIAYTFFASAWYALFATSRLSPVFLVAQLLAGLPMVHIWEGGAGALFAALVIAAAGLAAGHWRERVSAGLVSFCGFWLAYGPWLAQAGGSPPIASTLLLVSTAYLLFLAWPAWRASLRKGALRFNDLTLIVLNPAFYFGAAYALLQDGYRGWAGIFAAAVAVAQMAAARRLAPLDARSSLLAAGAAWVLLVLAVPIQLAGYRITIAWALEGAAATWIGVRLANRRITIAALLVFLLVLGRLAFLDAGMYPSAAAYGFLVNARFLSFAVAAAGLWATAWWLGPCRFALAAYVAGHCVMLWGLSLEAGGWAARTASPEDVRSVASTAISVLSAAYAVLMVAGGVARRHPVTRISGIVLIALVVLKLYLYDVWLLEQFYRMSAFAILGVLLLAMSYLYSRFRDSIGGWWRPGS